MTTITQTLASKAVVAFVAVAMIFTMFATPAQAQTAEDLQAQIAQLLEQINTLQSQLGQGGSNSPAGVCPYTWTRDLSMGSTGDDVMKLQQFLNSDADTRVAAEGAGSVGAETMYYGALTAAAVSKMQMKYMAEILTPNGLMQGTGYFGPSSRAKANAVCATAPVTVPDTDEDDDATEEEDEDEMTGGPLMGGEATLLVDTLLDSDVVIDLGKAEEVIQVELEAEDGDLAINRVDFIFNDRPWLYFAEVNLLVEGQEVASLSGSGDFSETGSDYRARFSGLDLVIREGEMVEATLELVTLSSLAGTRDQDTIEVTHPEDGIRFIDGAGLTSYEPGAAIGPVDVTFDDAFGEGDIRASVADDSPENATIVVDETSRTTVDGVVILDVEARDADMTVTDLSAELTVAGSGNTVGNVFYRAYLMDGATEIDRQSVSGAGTSATVVFDDIDYDIAEDEEVELSIKLEFNDGEDMGTTTSATFTVGDVVITSENPNFESATETVVVDETHNIVQDGIVATVVGLTTTANDNVTTLTVKMDVSAYGEDFWISEATATALTPNFTLPATTTLSVAPNIQIAGVTKNGSNNFRIQDGQTRELTATYSFTNNGTVLGFVEGDIATLTYGPAAGTSSGLTFTLGSPDFDLPTVQVNAPSN